MPPIYLYQCENARVPHWEYSEESKVKCDLYFPGGWGGNAYVIDDEGKRITLDHPGEGDDIKKVLGISDRFVYPSLGGGLEKMLEIKNPKIIDERTGYNSHCLCLDCFAQFDLDIGDAERSGSSANYSWRYYYEATRRRDERKCPKCGSDRVKTVPELIGETCPKCGQGKIIAHKWGVA